MQIYENNNRVGNLQEQEIGQGMLETGMSEQGIPGQAKGKEAQAVETRTGEQGRVWRRSLVVQGQGEEGQGEAEAELGEEYQQGVNSSTNVLTRKRRSEKVNAPDEQHW